jgi:hypothetical protein
VLTAGREIVERAAATWRIPTAFLDGDHADGWVADAADRVVAAIETSGEK